MIFPKIAEIATTYVTSVTATETLSCAVDLMLETEHRHIVVIAGKKFCMLSIHDLLRINREHTDKTLPLSSLQLKSLPFVNKKKSVMETLEYLRYDFEQIAVVNDDGSLYGVVAPMDILSSIDPDTLMDNYRLSDLLKVKKRNRWIDRNMTASEVLDSMEAYHHDDAIIVEEKKPIGIITTKDVLRLLKSHHDLTLPVECYMSVPVMTMHQDSTLNQVLSYMQDKHFKRIVIVNGEGHLAGSVTQEEMLSLVYSHWAKMIHVYNSKLLQINKKLTLKSRKFEKIAATDPLTGLYNRMKFLELFVSEYTVMVQRKNTLSLLLMDLDHFKQINDRYGHNIGDMVLRQVSNLLLHELRNVDIVCRWGGEEFVVLLPAADKEAALHIAEQLRSTVESLSFESIPKVTASIGISHIEENDTLQDVIERADKALYMAKMAGRNCVKSIA